MGYGILIMTGVVSVKDREQRTKFNYYVTWNGSYKLWLSMGFKYKGEDMLVGEYVIINRAQAYQAARRKAMRWLKDDF